MPSMQARGLVIGAVALVGSLVAVAAEVRVVLRSCLDPSWWTPLGLRFDVVESVAACPDDSYGLGLASRGAVVLLSIAVPALFTHIVLAAAGVVMSTVLASAIGVLGRFLLGWRHSLTAFETPQIGPTRMLPVRAQLWPRPPGHQRVFAVRGPPSGVYAQ